MQSFLQTFVIKREKTASLTGKREWHRAPEGDVLFFYKLISLLQSVKETIEKKVFCAAWGIALFLF